MRTIFANLKPEGSIRRVRRIGKAQVLWEAIETAPKVTPFEALLLPDAVAVVLGEGEGMRSIEIVIALHERGYRDANPRILANSLGAALHRCARRFQCGDDGKWRLAEQGLGFWVV